MFKDIFPSREEGVAGKWDVRYLRLVVSFFGILSAWTVGFEALVAFFSL